MTYKFINYGLFEKYIPENGLPNILYVKNHLDKDWYDFCELKQKYADCFWALTDINKKILGISSDITMIFPMKFYVYQIKYDTEEDKNNINSLVGKIISGSTTYDNAPPDFISRKQFALTLYNKNYITSDESVNFAISGTIPKIFSEYFSTKDEINLINDSIKISENILFRDDTFVQNIFKNILKTDIDIFFIDAVNFEA